MAKRTQGLAVDPTTATTAADGGAAAKSGPAHEVRLGRIKAVIWANAGEGGPRYNVTLKRIYKREGHAGWEQSDSFGRDDLPAVMEVTRQAWLWIFAQPST